MGVSRWYAPTASEVCMVRTERLQSTRHCAAVGHGPPMTDAGAVGVGRVVVGLNTWYPPLTFYMGTSVFGA